MAISRNLVMAMDSCEATLFRGRCRYPVRDGREDVAHDPRPPLAPLRLAAGCRLGGADLCPLGAAEPAIRPGCRAGLRRSQGRTHGGFGILALLSWRTVAGTTSWRRPWAWAFALTVLHAATDELHQGSVAGRHLAVADVGIDALAR